MEQESEELIPRGPNRVLKAVAGAILVLLLVGAVWLAASPVRCVIERARIDKPRTVVFIDSQGNKQTEVVAPMLGSC